MPKITPSNKRPVPGHPLRFSGNKAKQKESKTSTPQIVPQIVYLIDEGDCASEEDYSLTESMILIKAESDLKSTYSEENIRSELIDLFKAKLPLITKRDFDFVRRERNIITTPVVKADHQWDFKHVKHLCVQGKLYVRLNVSKDLLVDNEETEEDSDDKPKEESHCEPGKEKAVSNVGPIQPVINIDDQEQSTSAGSSYFDEGLANLTSIFPEEDASMIRDTLMRYKDVELAAQVLSERAGMEFSGAESGDESLVEVLKRLKKGMQNYGSAEKLKVHEEDLAVDFFQYYKNREFDPKIPIKIQLKGQAAIDSGGVLRQSFSTIFTLLAKNEFLGLRLFTGPCYRLTPAYSSESILTGVFEILGKMISHIVGAEWSWISLLCPSSLFIYCHWKSGRSYYQSFNC